MMDGASKLATLRADAAKKHEKSGSHSREQGSSKPINPGKKFKEMTSVEYEAYLARHGNGIGVGVG